MDNMLMNSDLLRKKSYAALSHRDLYEAIECRREIINRGEGKLGDYYLVGEWSVELKNYELAIEMLTYCIEKGYEQNSQWYENSAYILRAYSFIQLDNYQEARKDVENSYVSETISWLEGHPDLDKHFLLKLLDQ